MHRAASCLALGLALNVAACGKSAPPATAHAAAALCERGLLNPADLAGILVQPIVSHAPIAGDLQSCQFNTDGFPGITVSARPAVGRATVDAWAHGKMPLKVIVMEGIGDGAVWQASLHELIAQQNDLLCDVQALGADSDFKLAPDALPRALGELCGRIFSRF